MAWGGFFLNQKSEIMYSEIVNPSSSQPVQHPSSVLRPPSSVLRPPSPVLMRPFFNLHQCFWVLSCSKQTFVAIIQ
jgi:hypothetical protein